MLASHVKSSWSSRGLMIHPCFRHRPGLLHAFLHILCLQAEIKSLCNYDNLRTLKLNSLQTPRWALSQQNRVLSVHKQSPRSAYGIKQNLIKYLSESVRTFICSYTGSNYHHRWSHAEWQFDSILQDVCTIYLLSLYTISVWNPDNQNKQWA